MPMLAGRRSGPKPPYAVLFTVTVLVAALALGILTMAQRASALTVYASDIFNRTVSGGWGSADSGGAWTIAGTASRWSVAPGGGSFVVPPNGQERGYLGSVSVQDVEILVKVVLPRNIQNNNSLAYVLGRHTASGSYDRVGVGQGAGRSTIILRAQRSDGPSLVADLDTGIPAADGAVVWMRVQFQGVNPTTVRARAWADGTTEPTVWTLNQTDSNAAQQISGSVGVRLRNEDTASPHTFIVRSFQATPLSPPAPTATPTP